MTFYLHGLAKALASRLTRDIPAAEKVFVLWTLAKIHSHDLMPTIEAFRSTLPDHWPIARVADVVLLYFREGDRAVLGMIDKHSDHVRMEELAPWPGTCWPHQRHTAH